MANIRRKIERNGGTSTSSPSGVGYRWRTATKRSNGKMTNGKIKIAITIRLCWINHITSAFAGRRRTIIADHTQKHIRRWHHKDPPRTARQTYTTASVRSCARRGARRSARRIPIFCLKNSRRSWLHSCRAASWAGLNVAIPYGEAVIPYCDALSAGRRGSCGHCQWGGERLIRLPHRCQAFRALLRKAAWQCAALTVWSLWQRHA